MSVRRRGTAALVALAAALSLAACGTGGGADESSPPGTDADKKAVATGGKDFADAAKKTAGYGTDAKPGEFPRTVTHALGKTVLKARPERVIVLDVGEFDNVVSLGLEPVGYAPTEGAAAIPSYLKKGAGSPKSVGTSNGLNLEAIAALKPDLILGSQLRAADKYDELASIAPTVFSIRPGFPWKENLRLNAAALDRSAEAEKALDAYDAKVKALSDDIGADKPTISMVRYRPNETRLYGKASFIGIILQDIGLPRPANQQINDLAIEVSPEEIDQADADWIFTGVYGDPKSTKRDAARANPLWKNLKAVRSGQAIDVSDETWYLGLGTIAAGLVLDDLRGFLVK
ncbi:ABC transporter periplasmic component [Streptomyces camponoticapitis]|uniref:ABC transporter periplasmic component n=1 Tax=Streptomyces camponoticapitis TaxID=1616125 RepID=A0ABQ2E7R4_9ACTN|nr:iron-siderophore ABC transporter substrate-binding protein [Streptomyces camponoticapitis]GGJ98124.1 ABC transporter periplasmic component [Streptomyces camponoticapitis]